MTTTDNEPADLDALWGELLFQACASDGPIRDADVRDAIRIYRLKIERAAAERAIGAAPDPALAEKMTRLADSPRSKWHDEVLPNGAGDSWACVPIGDVMDALPPAERAIGAEALDVTDADTVRDRLHNDPTARYFYELGRGAEALDVERFIAELHKDAARYGWNRIDTVKVRAILARLTRERNGQ